MHSLSELIGYLTSTFSYALFGALVLVLWRGRFHGLWLLQALLFSFLWSAFFAGVAYFDYENAANQTFVEVLRGVGWVLLLWKLHSAQHGVSDHSFWRTPALGVFALVVLGALLVNLLQAKGLSPFGEISLEILAPFSLAVFGLVLLEQWYRNIKRENRWSVKFFALAMMTVLAYDFVLFSEALLYDRLDSVLWSVRGWVDAIMVPFMAVAVARTSDRQQPLRVSHQAAFYTTGILLAGGYLMVMAGVGYYLRWFGGGWGSALQVIFVVLSLSALIMLLASGSARGMLSVWLNKHFFAYKYDYREEWIKANTRFAGLPFDSHYYEELIRALADPVDSMGGWIWINEKNKLICKSSWSVDEELTLASMESTGSLIQYLETTGWIIELEELHENPERYEDIEIPKSLLAAEDLWLIVPLLHQNELYGLIGLRNPRANRSLNWEDYDLLKALGGQIASLVALRNASDALSEARQFEAFNRLSAFVVHDLKNIVAQLSLVVSNAEKHKTNPEFVDDALDTLSNAVNRMNRLLSQLRQQSQLNVNASVVAAEDIIREVQELQKNGKPGVVLAPSSGDGNVIIEKERFVSVLCHLVQNAQEATADDGQVSIGFTVDPDFIIFQIRDTGMGMDEVFIRDRLFKPFDTTKGSAGMGVGVYEAQQFVIQSGGVIEVESIVGEGTLFKVAIPKHKAV